MAKKAHPPELNLLVHVTVGQSLNGVRFSPDDAHIITAGFPGVHLYHIATGKKVTTYQGDTGRVCWLAQATPDSKYVLAPFGDMSLKLFNYKMGSLVHPFPTDPEIVTTLGISADGSRALTGHHKALQYWDVAGGMQLVKIQPKKSASGAVALSPKGKIGYSAGNDKLIHVWDLSTGKELAAWAGHEKRITSLSISADGKVVASTGWDRTVRTWDAASGKEMACCTDAHQKAINSIAISPDGRRIISGGNDHAALSDARTGTVIARGSIPARGNLANPVQCVAFSHDGRACAAAGWSDKVSIWSV